MKAAAVLAAVCWLQPAVAQASEPPPDRPSTQSTVPQAARAFRRGRRVTVSGLFLGWAGPGLAVGGTALALFGEESAVLGDRQVLAATVIGGAALSSVGLGLQLGGSSLQAHGLRGLGLPRTRRLRRVGTGLAVAGLVGSSVVAWRLLDDGPDGLWLTVGAPLTGAAILGATGVHTAVLLDADAQVDDNVPGLRVALSPSRHGAVLSVSGRW